MQSSSCITLTRRYKVSPNGPYAYRYLYSCKKGTASNWVLLCTEPFGRAVQKEDTDFHMTLKRKYGFWLVVQFHSADIREFQFPAFNLKPLKFLLYNITDFAVARFITAHGYPGVEAQREKIPALLGRNNKIWDVIQWKSQRFKVERGNLKLYVVLKSKTLMYL